MSKLETVRASLSRFFPGRRIALVACAVFVIFILVLGWFWSREPVLFDVSAMNDTKVGVGGSVVGSTSTTTLITVAETLLDKPGGYLSNDVLPPGLILDNMANWEFGALVQVRDFSRAFRENFSRSQSQSTEDVDLNRAEPKFNFDNNSWLFPATEGEYREAIAYLESYLLRITDPANEDAQFYSRADNLASWLLIVESRLGSLSQRLSASVGQARAGVYV